MYISINWLSYNQLGPNRDPQDEIACGMISFGPAEVGNEHNPFKWILQTAEYTSL